MTVKTPGFGNNTYLNETVTIWSNSYKNTFWLFWNNKYWPFPENNIENDTAILYYSQSIPKDIVEKFILVKSVNDIVLPNFY